MAFMTKIQKTLKKLLKIPNILYNLLKNITFQILWTKKGTKTLLFEQEQKGLKLISSSLVLGNYWIKRNIYGRKGNKSLVGND